MKLSIVIPAHNEAGSIVLTLREILSVIERLPALQSFQVIVVDDHSSDATYAAVESFDDSRVGCLRLARRSGSHTALRAGLRRASGDAAVCMSADGQDAPSALEEMVAQWRDGRKIVWALRRTRGDEPWLIRRPAQVFYHMLAWAVGRAEYGIDLSRADFFLLDRTVVEAINSCPERNTSLFGLLAWIGFDQGCVEYNRRERRAGASKWDFRSKLRLANDWIVAFSGLPLKMMSWTGFAVAAVGFLYALVVVFNFFRAGSVQGWSSMMVAVLLLSGVQMMMVGVIGEYLWRTLDESRQRPLCFVEKEVRGEMSSAQPPGIYPVSDHNDSPQKD